MTDVKIEKEKKMKDFIKKYIPLVFAGLFSILGLILGYKDYSYFYWGEVEPVVAMPHERYEPESREKIPALYNSDFAERPDVIEALAWYSLENHMQLKTTNNGSSSLFVSIYDYSDYINPVLKDSVIEILPGDHWTYDTKGGSYMLVVYGQGCESEEISFFATNVDYMYTYKNVVKYVLVSLVILFLLQLAFVGRPLLRKYLQIFDLVAGGAGTVVTMFLAYNPPWEDYIINSVQWYSVVLACYALAISWVNGRCAVNNNDANIISGDRCCFLAASVLAVAVSFLFFARSMNSRKGSLLNSFSWMNSGNVKAYAVMLILLVVVFIVLMIIFNHKFSDAKEILFDRNMLYSLLLVFCSCISRFVFYGNEGKAYNIVLWVIIFAAVFLCIYKTILWYSSKPEKIPSLPKRKYLKNVLCFSIYGTVVITTSLKQTIINCWGKGFADIYHAHWYFGRIPFVVNGDAFSGGIVDVYGHYGLWYQPIMDIFGHTSLVIGILFGVANALTVSIFLYMIHKTTDHLVIRLCGAVALGVSSIAGWIYPMTLTGRLFVVAITLFLIMKSSECIYKDCSIKKLYCVEIVGFIFGIFNIISSTDAGIISNCVWLLSASLFMVYAVEDKTEIKISEKIMKTIKSIVFHFILFVVQILLAYVIIKVWNYNHAEIPFHRILEYADEFNIESAGYDQNKKFIFHNGVWIYILIAFMTVFLWKLKALLAYYTNEKRKLNIKDVFIFSYSVMALGMFVFYISRPEDFLCVGDLFVLCVCLLADKAVFLSGRTENAKYLSYEKLIGTVLMTGCVFAFTVGFFNVGNAVKNEYDYIVRYHQLDWRYLTEEFEKFRQEVPENTYVEDNLGLPLVYMNIGRDMPDSMENCDYIICSGSTDDFDVNTEYIKTVSVDAINYNLYRIVR